MPTKLEITATKNGPLQAEGKTTIKKQSGETVKESNKEFLCRCGQSDDKPFCDGSHNKAGFEG